MKLFKLVFILQTRKQHRFNGVSPCGLFGSSRLKPPHDAPGSVEKNFILFSPKKLDTT